MSSAIVERNSSGILSQPGGRISQLRVPDRAACLAPERPQAGRVDVEHAPVVPALRTGRLTGYAAGWRCRTGFWWRRHQGAVCNGRPFLGNMLTACGFDLSTVRERCGVTPAWFVAVRIGEAGSCHRCGLPRGRLVRRLVVSLHSKRIEQIRAAVGAEIETGVRPIEDARDGSSGGAHQAPVGSHHLHRHRGDLTRISTEQAPKHSHTYRDYISVIARYRAERRGSTCNGAAILMSSPTMRQSILRSIATSRRRPRRNLP